MAARRSGTAAVTIRSIDGSREQTSRVVDPRRVRPALPGRRGDRRGGVVGAQTRRAGHPGSSRPWICPKAWAWSRPTAANRTGRPSEWAVLTADQSLVRPVTVDGAHRATVRGPRGRSDRSLSAVLRYCSDRSLSCQRLRSGRSGGCIGAVKRPTIYEVAGRAGVSHQTVSRYLQNNGGLKPATVAKVQAAIDELDYRPNRLARSMRTRRTGRIAILLPTATKLLPLRLLGAASATAHEAGYTVDLVGSEGGAADRAARAQELADSGEFEGILALASLGAQPTAWSATPVVVRRRLRRRAARARRAGRRRGVRRGRAAT